MKQIMLHIANAHLIQNTHLMPSPNGLKTLRPGDLITEQKENYLILICKGCKAPISLFRMERRQETGRERFWRIS